jgi:hypothetical protein
LATKKHKKHKEKLTTDFTDFTDLFGHKKAQKIQGEIGRWVPDRKASKQQSRISAALRKNWAQVAQVNTRLRCATTPRQADFLDAD